METWKSRRLSPLEIELEVLRLLGREKTIAVDPSGAVGSNLPWEQAGEGKLKISLQRTGETMIRVGIAKGDEEMVRSGIRALDWGFRQQDADGGFSQNKRGTHGVTFLLAAGASGEQMLRASRFADLELPARDRILGGLRAAGTWFDTVGWDRFLAENGSLFHQLWLLACAFGLTDRMEPDARMRARSHELVERAMAGQAAEGYFPELGGHDTGYHMSSVVRGQRWLMYCADDPLADAARESLGRGIDFQLARIDERGRIDDEGNTRTGVGDKRKSPGKGPGYANTAWGLAAWSVMTDRSQLAELAGKVWHVRLEEIDPARKEKKRRKKLKDRRAHEAYGSGEPRTGRRATAALA